MSLFYETVALVWMYIWIQCSRAQNHPSEIQKRKEFDASIESKLGPNTKPEDFAHDEDIETPTYELYEDQTDGQIHHAKKADEEESPITFDQYVNAEVMLPKGDQIITGTVKSRKRKADGTPVGRESKNPILDTRVYEVQFPEGSLADYGANIIAENMLSQCDIDGNQYNILDKIIDHKTT